MGRLTEEIFNPSCCEGSQCSTDTHGNKSTVFCGCDPGADWLCERHRLIELTEIKDDLHFILKRINLDDPLVKTIHNRLYNWCKS